MVPSTNRDTERPLRPRWVYSTCSNPSGGAELFGEAGGEQVSALVLGDRHGRAVGCGQLADTAMRSEREQDQGVRQGPVDGRGLLAAQWAMMFLATTSACCIAYPAILASATSVMSPS